MRRSAWYSRVTLCLSGIILSILMVVPVKACSSFAVYSNEVMYGVNFDYPGNPEVLFLMEQGKGEIRHLTMCFEGPDFYVRMVGMNTEGLMASLQSVPPRPGTPRVGSAKGLNISEAMLRGLQAARTIAQVREIVEAQRIIHVPGFDLHCLFADQYGKALIVEIGSDGNQYVTNTTNHIVMTNFYNSDFVGRSEEDIIAPGADRFRSALRVIRSGMGRFDLESGFDVLQSAMQPTTQASLVFFPRRQRVYFALRGDMARVWGADLKEGRIFTHRGFSQAKSVVMGEVTGSELRKWQ